MLANELIGKFCFDVRKKNILFIFSNGYAQWDLSGDSNAAKGLRTWLNSTGIHEGEGFHHAFSDSFKNTVLTTPVPNRDFQGEKYKTKDKVFIPSSKELGDLSQHMSYGSINNLNRIVGKPYEYFFASPVSHCEIDDSVDPKRVASLANNTWWYWTRSSEDINLVLTVTRDGKFGRVSPITALGGVRPTINIQSEVLVSEIKN